MDTDRFPLVAGMHIYKGRRFTRLMSAEKLDNLENIANIDDDDWLMAGYPKSGTHWLAVIMGLIKESTSSSGSLKDGLKSALSRPIFIDPASDKASHPNMEKPRILKAHFPVDLIPNSWLKNKIIVILRNPKDVAVSWYHFHRATEVLGNFSGSWDKFFDMFITGNVVYGSIIEWMKNWYQVHKDSDNVLFITYGEMKRFPAQSVKKIAMFLGRALSDEAVQEIVHLSSFESMSTVSPDVVNPVLKVVNENVSRFTRKGIEGDWKNHFTVAQQEIFDREYKVQMEEFPELYEMLN